MSCLLAEVRELSVVASRATARAVNTMVRSVTLTQADDVVARLR